MFVLICIRNGGKLCKKHLDNKWQILYGRTSKEITKEKGEKLLFEKNN